MNNASIGTADFLVELGTEELPPKALSKLSQAFSSHIVNSLNKAGLSFGKVDAFATPRRLAVKIDDLQIRQQDKASERKGPAIQASFKENGCPTPAAEGFARSCGVEVNQLDTLETDKGAWLVFRKTVAGKKTSTLLPTIIEESLKNLPIPKRMRWGNRQAQFVRPAHWLVMLFGNDIIDCEILELKSGRTTRGHRFHKPDIIEIPNPADYETLLEFEGQVVASFSKRRAAIKAQVEQAALKIDGTAIIDPDLLDEVTGLVEWPVAVLGDFDEKFLQIPPEALISAMKGHQKYFHIVKNDKLLAHFITVSNIDSLNPVSVKKGNERVINPRLSDADFFWNTDRKTPLFAELPRLEKVIFQKQLGTMLDKTKRLVSLSDNIATSLGENNHHARRAAELCKCDLMTEMVGEFPDLQGIMGRYYALHDQEIPEVAQAILEHYMPRFAGDHVPPSTLGQIVSLADKLDTLVGIFSIGQIPTGDKDPFALRRATLGVLRIMIEQTLPLDLRSLIADAGKNYGGVNTDTQQAIFDFMMDRLKAYYHDQGIRPQVFDAVLAVTPTSPLDFDARIKAVAEFEKSEAAQSLAAANKRIHNILKKNKETLADQVDARLFDSEKESTLNALLNTLQNDVQSLTEKQQYADALNLLAKLKEPVDAFFDEVMVMTEDPKVRVNRLTLLSTMYQQFTKVADISRLS